MPRMRRIVLPGYSHHILQRGHNNEAVFKGKKDYLKFTEDMQELREETGIRLYAWSLTSREVHLLVDPGTRTTALSSFMKGLSARTTHYRNQLETRSGTLWESRYRSSPVHPGWELACMRHIERAPLRAGLIKQLIEYPWSSLAPHMGLSLGLGAQSWLDLSPAYQSLGTTARQRQRQYCTYMLGRPSKEEEDFLRNAVLRCQLTGDADFAAEVEALTGIRVPSRGPGRPKKNRR